MTGSRQLRMSSRMMKNKILVATTSFAKEDSYPLTVIEEAGLEWVMNSKGRTLTREEIVSFGEGAIGIIAGTETYDEGVLRKLPLLRTISRCGSGLESIDLEAAAKLNIKVINTPDGPTLAVAELVVGLIIALLRKICLADRELRAGKWNKRMGYLLSGKRIGIVGLGRIGSKVADLLSHFSEEIYYFDLIPKNGKKARFAPMEELLSSVDILSIHVSGSKKQDFIIGESEIGMMKNGSWLINCSRGQVVDEKALCDALEKNKLAGAALDVYSQEPYDGPLAGFDNVILTPHIGSYAVESRIKMEVDASLNLIESLKTVR